MNHRSLARIATLSLAIALAAPLSAAETVHWGYEHGTEGWGKLDPSFEKCASGLSQSPIDVVTGRAFEVANLAPLTFQYGTSINVTLSHNGHSIVATPTTSNNVLWIGNQPYTLLQFHMHTPSENFLNGESYPLEYHFVHRNVSGKLAVVGVFFDDGVANAQIGALVGRMPKEGAPTSLGAFNLRALIPAGPSYRFGGSLTTPPCGEGVAWHVMGNIKTASVSQIAAFMNVFSGAHFPGGNRRPVQSLNGRVVVTED